MDIQNSRSYSDFNRITEIKTAFAEVRAVVGEQHLLTDEKEVQRKSRVILPYAYNPIGFAYPGTKEELLALVKIANKFKITLWPCSTGKNWGYGSATPAENGALVLVLERMNRILAVDEEMA